MEIKVETIKPHHPIEGEEITELLNDLIEKQNEIKALKEENQKLNECLVDMLNMNVEYNNTISHAIEYIEENCTEHGEGKWAYRTINADNILNILKEVDKE